MVFRKRAGMILSVSTLASGMGRGDARQCGEGLHHAISRTSVSWPVIAAAAAIAGESRWVRPPGPWRPSKLRLDVLAQRWPACEPVGVHAQAHRAAGLPPLEPGVEKQAIEPLLLGLQLHQAATGDH